jgi:hypothetical protein
MARLVKIIAEEFAAIQFELVESLEVVARLSGTDLAKAA